MQFAAGKFQCVYIRHADNIIVLSDGRIVEHGRHDELLAKRGAYYTMYHAQFEGV